VGYEAHVWQDGCGIGPAVAAWPLPTRADVGGRAGFLDRRPSLAPVSGPRVRRERSQPRYALAAIAPSCCPAALGQDGCRTTFHSFIVP
jgi:hypothetical protein